MNDSLIGKKLSTTWGGASGRSAESILKNQGVPLQNGSGPDNYVTGTEYKTRDLDATSPVSIGTSSIDDIERLDYEYTDLCKKLQYQKWYYTKNDTVIDEQFYDFTKQYLQEIFKADFNCIKSYFNNNPFSLPDYIPGIWGYWEYENNNSYRYRMSWSKMKKIKAISRQANIFEEM